MLVKRFRNFFSPKQPTAFDDCLELTPAQLDRFGFWLDFDPAVEARYEAETGPKRIANSRLAVCIGLIFYNANNITDIVIHNDILTLSWTLRLLFITPLALLLVWLIAYMPAQRRERFGMIGMITVIAVRTLLFYLSSDPLNGYSIVEVTVLLVFGCLMLVLRFPHAFIFTVSTFLMSFLASMMRMDMGPSLQFVFSFQILSVCAFVLLGNYRTEAVRRGVYLQELRERVRSTSLEKDRQTLKALSNTDFLTGIGNRRHFDDTLLLRRQDRAALTLLMIDVDFFKQFNDTYGHPVGDGCLCAVVRALQTELRSGLDVLSRFGGEEFVVLLPEVTRDTAQEVADRLRAAVEEAAIPHASRPDGAGVVTISIGGVCVEADRTETPQQLLRQADLALYDAKHLGRNRSVVYTCDTTVADEVKAA